MVFAVVSVGYWSGRLEQISVPSADPVNGAERLNAASLTQVSIVQLPAVFVPEIAGAFDLFLLRQAFGDVSRELFDAAFVDGFDTDHGSIDTSTGTRYTCRVVIRSIRHRGLKRAHERGDFRKVHSTHQTRMATILSDLDVADRVSELDLPTYQLHPLRGDLAGFWSVRVSRNWRIIFRFQEGDAYDVNLIDYH